ncbi:MAG: hypothetical protein EHM61_23670, partial [Acidobacteria bacterium]
MARLREALAEATKMGTATAGPGRRMAEGRFGRIIDEIKGPCPYSGNPDRPEFSKCVLCFKECPAQGERACMERIWHDAYLKTADAWLDYELDVVEKWRGNYDGIEAHLDEALKLDKAFAVIGLDTCTEKEQKKALTTIGKALTSILERIIKQGDRTEDIIRVGRKAELMGEVSPALAEAEWNALRPCLHFRAWLLPHAAGVRKEPGPKVQALAHSLPCTPKRFAPRGKRSLT